MPKFVPVTDTEKPKSEQSLYSDELLAHRQFDMPHAVLNSGSAGNSNSQEKRGWTQGEVGWGNLNKYGSDAADNGAQILRHAEGDQKMVKNEKGLWVKAKSINSSENKGELQGKGRGGRGIPVFDKYRQDLENKQSDNEGTEGIKSDDKRFEDARAKKEFDIEKDHQHSNRKEKKSSHRDRSGSSDRSASPHRRSHNGRSRDRGRDRDNDRQKSRGDRDSRDRRGDERSRRDDSRSRRARSRSGHKERRGDKDRHNRSRNDSRERHRRRSRSESRERHRDHRKRSSKYSDSDSDDDRRRKEKERDDRPGKQQRRASPSPSPPTNKHQRKTEPHGVQEKEQQLQSDEKKDIEEAIPEIQITAVQVLNHFHEVYSGKSTRRVEQIGELFHENAKIQSLRSDHKVYLKGREDIKTSFLKTQATNVTPSKRIYIEVPQFLSTDSASSPQLVTYACDFHRAATSPGLGDTSKDTVLLYECQDRFIVNVWGMNDADHLSQNENLTEDVVYEAKVWGLVEAVIQEKWSEVIQREKLNLKLVSHFHNYDKMEVWGM